MTTLAALASIPSRSHLLPQTLASLRPQVDTLCVYLNGYEAAPSCVLELADHHVLDPVNSGAERKLHWADKHDGLYLSCDDDLLYPRDYARRMGEAVSDWGGTAICTAHGREYEGSPRDVHDVVPGSVGTYAMTVAHGRLINHGGTGVMAWDAGKVHVPTEWGQRNIADMQVALWAQQAGVPMYLVPHSGTWIGSLAMNDPRGLWRKSVKEGHARRNGLLRTRQWYRWTE